MNSLRWVTPLLFALIFLISCSGTKTNSPAANYMLFMHARDYNFDKMDAAMSKDTMRHFNGAIFITDKKEIERAEKYFLAERNNYHKCGYHYEAVFMAERDRLSGSVPLNNRCEDFSVGSADAQKLLDLYGANLLNKPTHYIYDVEVPTTIEFKQIIKDFEKFNMHVFILEGRFERYSYLQFSYTHNTFLAHNKENKEIEMWGKKAKENEKETRAIVDTLIKKLREQYLVERVYEEGMYSDWQDSIISENVVGLNAKPGTDLTSISKFLEKEGASVNSVNVSYTYTIQALDTTNDIEKTKEKLGELKYIKNISFFND